MNKPIILLVCFISCFGVMQAQSSSLWFGYYQEDAGNNPEDPMIGLVYLHIPNNGEFSGELIFSYQGCEGGMQRGRVSGQVNENVISGNWSGTVDNVAVAGGYSGQMDLSTKGYSGIYINSEGKKKIECDWLTYYVAGKGTWQVYGSNEPFSINIDISYEEGIPFFNWTDFDDLETFRFVIVDLECLIEQQDLEQCMVWNGEYVFSDLEYGMEYGDLPPSRPLIIGKNYLIHVLAYGENGSILGSASKEFIHQ
ncbi:hypothetical protein [Muriicola sp.]|uniref:hypothetical protein n=1 Tax=Muriicola sp. TaxID=2020856 RepID=UPI003C76F3E5